MSGAIGARPRGGERVQATGWDGRRLERGVERDPRPVPRIAARATPSARCGKLH